MLRGQAAAMWGIENLDSHLETCLEAANRIEKLVRLKAKASVRTPTKAKHLPS